MNTDREYDCLSVIEFSLINNSIINKKMSEQKNVCPETNLVWAILCTCLCCLPLGIVAILKATSVEKLWGQERYEEARRASEDAKKYSIILRFMYGLVMIMKC